MDTPFKRYLAAKKKNKAIAEYIKFHGDLSNVVYCHAYGIIPRSKWVTSTVESINLGFKLNRSSN